MSNDLSPKEQKLVDAYGTRMLKNGVTQKKVNKTEAKRALNTVYTLLFDHAAPKVVFCSSPEDAITKAKADGALETAQQLSSEIVYFNQYTGWVAFYHAGINILKETKGVEKDLINNLNKYEKVARTLHAALMFKEVVYSIAHPKVFIKDNDFEAFRLHRENGLALEYPDGTGFAWLNGVAVPDYFAVTPADKLDAKVIMAETNVDARREGLARMNPATVLEQIGARVIDKVKDPKIGRHWDYELLNADFKDGKTRKLLKMFDVGSNKYTIERIPDDNCLTVLAALSSRDGEESYIVPVIRT